MYTILHVITGFHLGGAERVLYNLITQKNDSKHIIIVLKKDIGIYGKELQENGYIIHSLNIKRKFLSIINGFYQFYKLVNKYSPTIIHSWLFHSALFVLPWAKRYPIIWSNHTSFDQIYQEKKSTRIIIYLCKIFSNIPKKIIYVSNANREQYQKYGFSNNGIYIPNGIDINLFQKNKYIRTKLKKKYNIYKSTKVIGMFARYHQSKDYPNMLKAMKYVVQKSDISFILFLAGDNLSKSNSKLMSLIKTYNLEKFVYLLGPISKVEETLQVLDLACLSSFSESLPMFLLEAMATETPCVATDTGGIPLLLKDCGIVVPTKQAVLLGKAIVKFFHLTSKQQEKLKQNSRKKIILEYSLEKMKINYDKLYKLVNSK